MVGIPEFRGRRSGEEASTPGQVHTRAPKTTAASGSAAVAQASHVPALGLSFCI